MSALCRSKPTSSTLAAFPSSVFLNVSFTSCIRHPPTSISSISFSSSISSPSAGFVGSSLFKFHLSALPISAIFLVILSYAPPICLSPWICCIAPCFYHSQWSSLLLQPSPPTNSSYPPRDLFTSLSYALYASLHRCFSCSDLAPSIFHFASFLSLIFLTFCLLFMVCSAFSTCANFLCGISVHHQDLVVLFLWIFYISLHFKHVFHFSVISPPNLFTSQLTCVKPHPCFLLLVRLCSEWGQYLIMVGQFACLNEP